MRVDLPEQVPQRFRNPGPYLVAACKKKFETNCLLHAFAHERLIVLICNNAQTSVSVRSFANDLLARMVEDTRTFRLRIDGTAALSKALVVELTAKLGRPQSVEMKGSQSAQYGDHAFITTRAPTNWQWPKKLHFRAYNLDLVARLSLAPEGPNAPPRADGMEADGWHRVSDRKKQRPAAAKTQLCRDFRRGDCGRGESCTFRHGASNICAVSGCQGGCGNRHITKATSEACRDFARGRCERRQCKFQHASRAHPVCERPAGFWPGFTRCNGPRRLGPWSLPPRCSIITIIIIILIVIIIIFIRAHPRTQPPDQRGERSTCWIPHCAGPRPPGPGADQPGVARVPLLPQRLSILHTSTTSAQRLLGR